MPRGGERPGSGPAPKLNPDGTRVHPKRVKRAPGEPPRPRGRPPKLNPDGTRALPTPARAKKAAIPVEVTAAPAPQHDFSNLPFPDVTLDDQPLDVLMNVMRDRRLHPEVRLRAAQMALPFTALKPGEAKKGKKEQQQARADELAGGGSKFTPGRAPLSVVGKVG